VPYPLVILHHLKKWREEHDGQAPSTSDEKRVFRERLRREARQPTQQNIEEAVSAANTALLKPRVSASARRGAQLTSLRRSFALQRAFVNSCPTLLLVRFQTRSRRF
jgi:hypothetical protein